MMGWWKILKGINWLSDFFARIAGLALFVMMMLVCYGVVMRYVFRSPVAAANEVAQFSFLVIVAFGLAYALQQGAHVAAEFFLKILPRWARRWLYLFSMVLFLIYAVISCWAGWRIASIALAKGLYSEDAKIPLIFILAFIPIGFFALILQSFAQIWKTLSGDSGEEPASKI